MVILRESKTRRVRKPSFRINCATDCAGLWKDMYAHRAAPQTGDVLRAGADAAAILIVVSVEEVVGAHSMDQCPRSVDRQDPLRRGLMRRVR